MTFRNKPILTLLLLTAAALTLSACSVQSPSTPGADAVSPAPTLTAAEPEPVEEEFIFPPTPTPEYKIEVLPGEDGDSSRAVQVSDPTAAEIIRQLSLDGIYAGHYHPAEYHDQQLFVILDRSPSEEEPVRELWRFGPDGEGQKLFTSSRIDFRVDPVGKKIAVESTGELDENRIAFLNWDGEILQNLPIYTAGENEHTYPRKWSRDGRYFWGVILLAGPYPEAFYRIDTQNWSSTIYNANLGFSHDYDLNPDTGILAFSDYPTFFEPTSRDRFVIQQREITLSLFDLERAEQTDLTTAPSHAFHPRWISDDVLAYDNLDIPGRILHSLSTGNTILIPGEDDSLLMGPQAVPPGFENLLYELKSTGIDPVLPPEFSVEAGQPLVHPRVETLEPGLYRVVLELGEDCGGAMECTYGTLAARDVTGSESENSLLPILGTGPILPVGLTVPQTGFYTTGYYLETDCGPECTEAQVSFLIDRQEYLFSLLNHTQGEVTALAQAALTNSLPAE